MEDVTLAHAKEHLDELFERASRGEDVRISDPKLGTIRLVPAPENETKQSGVIFGQWKGRMAEIPTERLLAPLSEEDLAWLSGEQSPVER